MYIDRKGWDIAEIYISLNLLQNNEYGLETTFLRTITFTEKITEAQRERLLLIAEKCPISKLLKNKISINTQL